MKFILTFIVVILVQSIAIADQTMREVVPHDNFVIREEMVTMRDGVKLYTIILSPKKADALLPILLQRTPYDASNAFGAHATARLEVTLQSKYMGDDYIYVFQDIRGRFSSEGEYVMYRPPIGDFNTTNNDETTDAWDTIDWLVKNIPSNGRVGMWGTSYPGWLTLAAMRDPHPALAAAIPSNPVVDVWKADDWFHWGAFRAAYAFEFIYEMESRLDEFTTYPHVIKDIYTWMMGYGSAAKGIGSHMDDRHNMWKRIMEFPAYGPYWRDVAADQWFDNPKRLVPALHIHGFWDQEDIYGAPAVYAAIERHDKNNDMNFFAAGPWYHGQHFSEGSRLGDLNFDANTAKHFRENVLEPFFRRYLHDSKINAPAPVTVFETGHNRWREFEQWPPVVEKTKLYLHAEGALGFSPSKNKSSITEYISSPETPVPYAPRPNWSLDYSNPSAISAWREWQVKDQRFVDGRPDVVTWVSEPLSESMTIRGAVTAQLSAETTGSDADWVVKLIDVYPDDNPEFEMSGYQLMISGEIFRGRYRENHEEPIAIVPNKALDYSIPLPHVNHTFKAGHRLMVQVQSTWFPLYDRNPQTFVPSIMTAPPEAYKSQTHSIHHGPDNQSYIELLVDEN